MARTEDPIMVSGREKTDFAQKYEQELNYRIKKKEAKVPSNDIQLASDFEDAFAGLAKVLATPTQAPDRKMEFGYEKDPFNLLDVADTYEVKVGRMFNACEGFASIELGKRPNRPMLKDLKDGKSLIFRSFQLSTFHSFQLVRAETSGSVQYSFRRSDDKMNRTGFDVIKQSDGHLVLRNGGDTVVSDDEKYWDTISRAETFLVEYFTGLGFNAPKLFELTPGPIPKYSRLPDIDLPKPVLKVAHGTRDGVKAIFCPKTKAIGDQYYNSGPRKFSGGRLVAIGLLGIGAVTSANLMDNYVINNSEHYRESFDARQLSLPGDSVIEVGEKAEKPEMITIPRTIINGTPLIRLGSGDTQNLKGIRSVAQDGVTETSLETEADSCQTLYADLGDANGVRAVTDNAYLRDNLTIEMKEIGGEKQLTVCNTGEQNLGNYEESDIDTRNHFWLEAV